VLYSNVWNTSHYLSVKQNVIKERTRPKGKTRQSVVKARCNGVRWRVSALAYMHLKFSLCSQRHWGQNGKIEQRTVLPNVRRTYRPQLLNAPLCSTVAKPKNFIKTYKYEVQNVKQ